MMVLPARFKRLCCLIHTLQYVNKNFWAVHCDSCSFRFYLIVAKGENNVFSLFIVVLQAFSLGSFLALVYLKQPVSLKRCDVIPKGV